MSWPAPNRGDAPDCHTTDGHWPTRRGKIVVVSHRESGVRRITRRTTPHLRRGRHGCEVSGAREGRRASATRAPAGTLSAMRAAATVAAGSGAVNTVTNFSSDWRISPLSEAHDDMPIGPNNAGPPRSRRS